MEEAGRYRPGAFGPGAPRAAAKPEGPRVDEADGASYTKADFLECYGGSTEWHWAGLGETLRQVIRGTEGLFPVWAEEYGQFMEGTMQGDTFYASMSTKLSKDEVSTIVSLLKESEMGGYKFGILEGVHKKVHTRNKTVMERLTDAAGKEGLDAFRATAVKTYLAPSEPEEERPATVVFLDSFLDTFGTHADEVFGYLVSILPCASRKDALWLAKAERDILCKHTTHPADVRALQDRMTAYMSVTPTDPRFTADMHRSFYETLAAQLPLEARRELVELLAKSKGYEPHAENLQILVDIDAMHSSLEALAQVYATGCGYSDSDAAQTFDKAVLVQYYYYAVEGSEAEFCEEVLLKIGADGLAGDVASIVGPDDAAHLAAVFPTIKKGKSQQLTRLLREAAGGEARFNEFRQEAVAAYMQAPDDSNVEDAATRYWDAFAAHFGRQALLDGRVVVDDMCAILGNARKERGLKKAWNACRAAASSAASPPAEAPLSADVPDEEEEEEETAAANPVHDAVLHYAAALLGAASLPDAVGRAVEAVSAKAAGLQASGPPAGTSAEGNALYAAFLCHGEAAALSGALCDAGNVRAADKRAREARKLLSAVCGCVDEAYVVNALRAAQDCALFHAGILKGAPSVAAGSDDASRLQNAARKTFMLHRYRVRGGASDAGSEHGRAAVCDLGALPQKFYDALSEAAAHDLGAVSAALDAASAAVAAEDEGAEERDAFAVALEGIRADRVVKRAEKERRAEEQRKRDAAAAQAKREKEEAARARREREEKAAAEEQAAAQVRERDEARVRLAEKRAADARKKAAAEEDARAKRENEAAEERRRRESQEAQRRAVEQQKEEAQRKRDAERRVREKEEEAAATAAAAAAAAAEATRQRQHHVTAKSDRKERQQENQRNRDAKAKLTSSSIAPEEGGGGGGGGGGGRSRPAAATRPTHWPCLPKLFWEKNPSCAFCGTVLSRKPCTSCTKAIHE